MRDDNTNALAEAEADVR